MFLAIDIGNTTVSFGVLKKFQVLKNYDVESRLAKALLKERLKKTLQTIDDNFSHINEIVICSVVPSVTKIIIPLIEKQFDLKPVVIGRDIKVPIKNAYHHPQHVGQDRLVCAYAASELYGRPAVVIDLGTAITFDVVSRGGTYEGGMIIPGIQLSADSLFQKTALLPRIETIHGPKNLIGKTTKESILSGIFNGYGVMCSGLIDLIARKTKGRPKVVLTGGYTDIMKKYIQRKDYTIDQNLVFKGILLVHKKSS